MRGFMEVKLNKITIKLTRENVVKAFEALENGTYTRPEKRNMHGDDYDIEYHNLRYGPKCIAECMYWLQTGEHGDGSSQQHFRQKLHKLGFKVIPSEDIINEFLKETTYRNVESVLEKEIHYEYAEYFYLDKNLKDGNKIAWQNYFEETLIPLFKNIKNDDYTVTDCYDFIKYFLEKKSKKQNDDSNEQDYDLRLSLMNFLLKCISSKKDGSRSVDTKHKYLEGKYKNYDISISFGQSKNAATYWFAFLNYGQEVPKGIYPVILYNLYTGSGQKKNPVGVNNVEICYGVSSNKLSEKSWPESITKQCQPSKSNNYKRSFVRKTYTINNNEEIQQNIDDIVNVIDGIIDETDNYFYPKGNSKGESMSAKNQILYGPPGTGKTYNTVIKAMEIIGIPEKMPEEYNGKEDVYSVLLEKVQNSIKEKQKYEDYEYEILKKEFDKQLGKQIEFITFHQSYSYEEFVEGIKPVVPDGKDWGNEPVEVKYSGKDGIFKKICLNAKPIANSKKNKKIDFSKQNVFKMSLGDSTKDEDNEIFDYCIKNNCVALGYSDIDITECKDYKQLKETYTGEKGLTQLKCFKFDMQKDDIVIISRGNLYIRAIGKIKDDYVHKTVVDINYTHFREVKWLYVGDDIPASKIYNRNITQKSAYKMDSSEIKKEELNKIIAGDNSSDKKDNYVLIIDEINRGNISKIFGELITLIEDDKREKVIEDGKIYNTLKVTLPYSSNTFSVPNNLYIIGTMNTADRSIALLDTALRRRFDFEEMIPQESLIDKTLPKELKEYNLSTFLKNLNEEIAGRLSDDNYKIGHAYLMNLKTIDDLKRAIYNKIFPLLQEYFYNEKDDLEKVTGFSTLSKLKEGENWKKFIEKYNKENTKQ